MRSWVDTMPPPIDAIRNAAFSMKIDSAAGALRELIPIGEAMYLVADHAIYAVRLADQIDPARTNPALPNVQQKVCALGAADAAVAAILLTGRTLFDQRRLGPQFAEDSARKLALNLLLDVAALTGMRDSLALAETAAQAAFETRPAQHRGLDLPVVEDIEARVDALSQKAGHIVANLRKLVGLFYTLPKKWIDSLAALTIERYGAEAPFATFMQDARPLLLDVIALRNAVEHPASDNHVDVHNFRLMPDGRIALPSITLIRVGRADETAGISPFLTRLIEDLTLLIEIMIVHLCAVHVQPSSGVPLFVTELPEAQRAAKLQRYYYATMWGGRLVQFG